ncbi:MAG: tetratricopeptide repeat protein [Spartobacteria bacterium]|nr:tetratricopeptide repeat protein [Spartobacteria bacterium]
MSTSSAYSILAGNPISGTSLSQRLNRRTSRMDRRRIGLLVVCLLLPLSVSAMSLQERMQFADGLYTRGMYDMAAREYEGIAREYPDTPRMDVILFRMGECWRQTGDTTASESCYARVVSQFPESEFRFKALLRRAEIARTGGRLPEASAILKGLMRQEVPDTLKPAVSYELGCVYAEMDMPDRAAETFRELLRDYPESSYVGFAAMELAGLLKDQPDSETEIRALYKTAAEQSASERMSAEAWLRLADAAFQDKDYDEAARAYEEIITKHPGMLDDPRVQLQVAWTYYHAKRYADALHMVAYSTKKETARAEELYLMANAQRQLMKTAEALETYDLLLTRFPDSPLAESAVYEKALLAYNSGDHRYVVEHADALLATREEAADIHWLLAESYAAMNQPDKATQHYRLLITDARDPAYAPRALYRLARLLRERDACAQAVPLYEQLVDEFPEDDLAPQALVEAAWCLTQAGEEAKAVRQWSRLIERYPDAMHVEEALYQKAMLEVRLERNANAIQTFEELVTRYPRSAKRVDALFWTGVLYENDNQLKDAREAFEAALKADPASKEAWRIRYHLVSLLQRQEEDAGAAEIAQELLDDVSDENELPRPLLDWLIRYRLDSGEYALAEAAARVLLAELPDAAWRQKGYYLLGVALAGQDKSVSAMDAFRESMQQDVRTPEGTRAALELGLVALAAQDFSEADKAFQKAAKWASAPDMMLVRARAYHGLGMTELGQKNYDAAARYFMSVGVLYDHPDLVPECLYRAAEAFKKAGQPDQYKKVVDELRQRYPDSPWTEKVI